MSPQRAGAGAVGAPVPVNSAARRGRRGWSLLAVVAGSTFPVLAACGGTPAAAPPPTSAPATTRVAPPATTAAPATTATTATTAPVPVDDETQVRAVIDTYWQEWTIAIRDSDPDRAALLATLDGDAKDRVVADLRKASQLGQFSVRSADGPVPHRTLSVSLAGDAATVTECAVDDTSLIERSTNSTLNNLTQSYQLTKALSKVAGAWRIVDSTSTLSGDGEAGCVA